MTQPPKLNPHRPVRFIVVDAAGAILRWGQCSARALPAQEVAEGERLIDLPRDCGAITSATHRVDLSTPARPRLVAIEPAP